MVNLVPIKNVTNPTYVKTVTQVIDEVAGEPITADLETYGGFIGINASESAGKLAGHTYRSFIPVGFLTLRPYDPPGPQRVLERAVTVSIAATADKDDETNIITIDSARLDVRGQEFPGLSGEQNVLALTFDIGLLNARLVSVSYSITVASAARGTIHVPFDIDEGTTPV